MQKSRTLSTAKLYCEKIVLENENVSEVLTIEERNSTFGSG